MPIVHRFIGWELRPAERLLLVDSAPVKVGGRAFDVLVALVAARGRVLSKDELLSTAWPGLVVEENNLSVQIAALRKLIGASAIMNVAGRGYRLAAKALQGGTPVPEEHLPPQLAPPMALLLGRDSELQALERLLQDTRLVTIVGAGGVGKTSLARHVLDHATWVNSPVHWVDLAHIRPGTPLLQKLARHLGIEAQDRPHSAEDLMLAMTRQRCAVVLDNCEHIAESVSELLGPLLRRAANVRWLATSQEPLGVAGEAVFRLQPLAVPLLGEDTAQALRSPALQLLVRRAREADHRFELRGGEIAQAAELCRQLDGLPLAIEMAAARVASLGLAGVEGQLADRLRLRINRRDAPARHHTLQQTYEWSCGLLSPVEQCVFRRLEPFVGGFSLALAQDLCGAEDFGAARVQPWQVADAIEALLNKSLLHRSENQSGARLHLMESGRDFARLQLESAGESHAAQAAHARAMARWFADAHQHWLHDGDAAWASRYLPDRRNVAQALAWACADGDPDVLARLVAALAQLDSFAQTQAEVVDFPVPGERLEQASMPLRARARVEYGWAHFLDGSRELGTELCIEALSDFEAMHDVVGSYLALLRLVRLYQGRPGLQARAQQARERLQALESPRIPLRARLLRQVADASSLPANTTVDRLRELHAIARAAGFEALAAVCRVNITNALLVARRFDEVVSCARQLLDEGEPWTRMRAMICHNLALALVRLDRVEEAREPARAMLQALPSGAHMLLDIFALAYARQPNAHEAALMAGCSARIKRERDRHPEPAEAAAIADARRLLAETLGPQRFDELASNGEGMKAAELLAIAIPPD